MSEHNKYAVLFIKTSSLSSVAYQMTVRTQDGIANGKGLVCKRYVHVCDSVIWNIYDYIIYVILYNLFLYVRIIYFL